MSIKTYKVIQKIFYIIAVVYLIIAGVSVFFLPDQVIVHIGPSGADYGSKYSNLVVMFIPLVITFVLDMLFKRSIKQNDNSMDSPKIKGTFILISAVMAFAYIMLFWVAYCQFNPNSSVSYTLSNSAQLLSNGIFLSVLMIIFGIFATKIKPGHFIGIRTKRISSNKVVWEKTHQLAQGLFITFGIISLVCCFIWGNVLKFWLPTGLIILLSIVLLIYGETIARKHKN